MQHHRIDEKLRFPHRGLGGERIAAKSREGRAEYQKPLAPVWDNGSGGNRIVTSPPHLFSNLSVNQARRMHTWATSPRQARNAALGTRVKGIGAG